MGELDDRVHTLRNLGGHVRRASFVSAAVAIASVACGSAPPASDDDDGGSTSVNGGATSGSGGAGGKPTGCDLQKPELGAAYCPDAAPDMWSCPPDVAPPDAACSLSALPGSYCCPAPPSPCRDFCTALSGACPNRTVSFIGCREACDEVERTSRCELSSYFTCAASASYTCQGEGPQISACDAELATALSCLVTELAPPPVVVQRDPTLDLTCDIMNGLLYRPSYIGFHAYNLPSPDFMLPHCFKPGDGCGEWCDASLCCGLP